MKKIGSELSPGGKPSKQWERQTIEKLAFAALDVLDLRARETRFPGQILLAPSSCHPPLAHALADDFQIELLHLIRYPGQPLDFPFHRE